MDDIYHYPPELLALLVDTVPLLCRSKQDTLLFLKGAGVDDAITADLSRRVREDRENINKYEIVRTVLARLNERGERALRQRREVVKRVVEFDDFSTCWESDRLKAQGLVAQIQKLVGVKDSFTRMTEERDRERQESIAKREKELAALQRHRQTMDQLKSELAALFAEPDPRKRGKKLEDVLNRLCKASGISVRQAFALVGADGEGIVEQIDGVIELEGHLYFVEMKWWKDPVGVPEISQHLTRVFFRAQSRALIISASEYTAPAVATCKEALSQKVVTLCTLQEIVMVLESRVKLADFLVRKANATIIEKNPFPIVSFE